jgi:hypothetical protein
MFGEIDKALMSLVEGTHNSINEKLEELNSVLRGSFAESLNKV